MGGEVPCNSRYGEPPRLYAAVERATSPRGIGLRQGQRGVDSREVQGMGARRQDRGLRRPVPDAEGAGARVGGPDAVYGEAGRAYADGRSSVGATPGAVTD